MTTFTDSFTGTAGTNLTAHALDTGQAWAYSADGGSSTTLQLNGSGRAVAAGAGFVEVLVTTLAASDPDVSLDVYLHDTNDAACLILRANNSAGAGNGYNFQIDHQFGYWAVSVFTDQQLPTLIYGPVALSGVSVVLDALLSTRFVVSGTTLKAYAGGVLQATITNSSITAAGYVGFSLTTTSHVMTVDNFSAVIGAVASGSVLKSLNLAPAFSLGF